MQFGTLRVLGTTKLVQEITPSTLWVTLCGKCKGIGIITISQLKLGEHCFCRNSTGVRHPIRCQLTRPVVPEGDIYRVDLGIGLETCNVGR
jgi:hypothetical protein